MVKLAKTPEKRVPHPRTVELSSEDQLGLDLAHDAFIQVRDGIKAMQALVWEGPQETKAIRSAVAWIAQRIDAEAAKGRSYLAEICDQLEGMPS